MDDLKHNAVIKSALKDLDKFIAAGKGSANRALTVNSLNSSHLKLSYIHASQNNSTMDSLGSSQVRQISFSDADISGPEKSFAQKHSDNVVGFDILKEMREKTKEVIEGHTKITVLEGRIESIQAWNKETCVKYEAEIESLRRNDLSNKDLIDDLRFKLKQLKKRDNDVKNTINENYDTLSRNHRSLKQQLIEDSRTHIIEKTAMVEEIAKLRNNLLECQKGNQEKELTIVSLNAQTEALNEDLKSIHERHETSLQSVAEVDRLNFKVSQQEMEITELNHKLDSLKEYERKLSDHEDNLKKMYQIKHELFNVKQENHDFKSMAVNICVVEEQLSSTKKELKFLESHCRTLTCENETLLAMKDRFEQYENVLKEELNLLSLPPVTNLRENLRTLYKADTDLQKSIDALKSGVKSHEATRVQQEELVGMLRGELESCRETNRKHTQLIRRLQRKVLLVSKERENSKAIISSYESESTLNPSAIEREKVANLEEQLEAYRAEISRLEIELEQLPPSDVDLSSLKTVGGKVSTKVAQMEKKIIELEDLVESLTNEKETLEFRINTQIPQGAFDPATTKVIEFLDNPLSHKHGERVAEMGRLQKENDALRCRIQLMEQGENMNLTQKVGVTVPTLNAKYIQDLESKLEQNELNYKRLEEVSQTNLYNVHDVLHKLFGYRLQVSESRYTLYPIFCDNSDDYLLFDKDALEGFQLLETEFSLSFTHLIDEYLVQENSFPAFLAAVMMELSNRSPDEGNDEEERPPKRMRLNEDEDDLICLD